MKTYTQKELERAHEILNAEREAEREEQRTRTMKFLGRYFRCPNRFSGDGGWWWLYVVPAGVDDHGFLYGLKFEHRRDSDHDDVQITAHEYLGHEIASNYEEISEGACFAAFREALTAAANYKPEWATDPQNSKAAGGTLTIRRDF